MAEEKALASAAEAGLPAAADLTTSALTVLLSHDSVGFEELGCISSLSHALHDASLATAWHAVFTQASKVAAGPFAEYTPSCCSIPCPCGYCDFVAWLKQREVAPGSFPDCFINPDASILSRVGYNRASRCLLSETCHRCGDLASRANPLTLNRTCPSCAEEDESSALISGSKVSYFYLDPNDVVDIPMARVDVSRGGASSVVYLLSDVVAAAYAKYGGKESFLALWMDKNRPTRQNPSRRCAEEGNPYKRVKEENVFDPLSLRCRGAEALPIGVIDRGCEEEKWTSRQPIKCTCCAIEGSPKAIATHEWFAHGKTIEPMLQRGDIRSNRTERFFTSRYAQLPEESEELSQLLTSVTAEYSFVKDMAYLEGERMGENLEMWRCKFDFGNGCQIAIHFRDHSTPDYIPDGSVGVYSQYLLCIEAQTGNTGRPSILLANMFLDWFEKYEVMEEADAKIFAKVIAALGLSETSASQLLTSLISRVSTMHPDAYRPDMLITGIAGIPTLDESAMSASMPVVSETRDQLVQLLYPRR